MTNRQRAESLKRDSEAYRATAHHDEQAAWLLAGATYYATLAVLDALDAA